MSIDKGVLYVVPTPIGNLEDITLRALEVLAHVDLILVEDTRHSARLLSHYAIRAPRSAFHEHNERRLVPRLVRRIAGGETMALVSDAGTPLIRDPGYELVHALRAQGIRVVPLPGANAAVCALSAAGLPAERFVFEGFAPAAAARRRRHLGTLATEPRTMIFYEAPHRIRALVDDLAVAFGPDREAVLAREISKAFEELRSATLGEHAAWLAAHADRCRGEFVVLVGGSRAPALDEDARDAEIERTLRVLLEGIPLKQAVDIAVKLTGEKKNRVYRAAVRIDGQHRDP